LTAPGGDELAAMARLREWWGKDWGECHAALVTLLAAGGREWAMVQVAQFPIVEQERA
jgi:hypothetical protein